MSVYHSDWSGGDTINGHWTGTPYLADFIPANSNSRPPRGLVSFYLDTNAAGSYSRKNAAQRNGTGSNFLWSFLPSFITIAYGLLWMVVDGEVKRHEKSRHLLRSSCTGASSICLDYHCFWVPLSLLQALRYRH